MQTSVDRPRFRQDLVAEALEDGGAKFIDVLDPDSGKLYRFFEVEYSLACAMDGQRDVAGIVRWAEEELGLKANANEIRTVINTLGDLGYLESGAAAAAVAATPMEKPAAPKAAAGAAAGKAATNRWDQPTAMGEADEYLKPGVVAAKPTAAAPSGIDVELGHAGTARAAKAEDIPRAPELELGAPGSSAPAARGPAAKAEDVSLGASGRQVPDVSVDLSEQVGISVGDVKEAVRASQVMKAVDVPPELLAELESPKAAPKVEAKKPEPTPAPKVEAKKPEPTPAPKAEKKPEPKVEKKPEPKVEAKGEAKKTGKKGEAKKPVVEEKIPTPPPPAPARTSPVLIAVLVLAILGAGGLIAYKFVFAKKSEPTTTGVKELPPAPPPIPEPPPVETTKLAVEQPAAEEIKPAGAGQIAVLVANDTVVKMGDPVAKLVGFKSLEADVANIEKNVTKLKTDVANTEKERDAAQAAGNKAGVTSAEKRLESATKTLTEQETKLGTKKSALDKFLIKAPAAGKVAPVAKANAKITPTDVVATLTREPVLVATFKKADGATADAHVLLAIKGSEQKLSCTVAQAGPEGAKIVCAKDAAPEGSEVSFLGVDPNAAPPPPPADPIETHDTGSAAGSAETGSADVGSAGSAAAGSAETKVEPKVEKKRSRPRPRPRPTPAGGETGSAPAETPPPADPAPAPGSDGQ